VTPRSVPAPAIWGIGVVGSTPWAVSAADIDDEAASATTHLAALGVRQGGLVLLVSRLAHTIHVAPLERAAGMVGARWSSADATAGDARRTEILCRQLAPDAVAGVDGVVTAALIADGHDLGTVFGGVPAVAVTDRVAHRAVSTAGCAPRWWLRLGPANAVECSARAGAHVDPARWSVGTRGGEVTITNVAPRLTPSEDLHTGVRGAVDGARCACGSDWPRVVVG